jgi:hypothetical protein
VATLNALQDFFSFFAAVGHDFWELFEQGFGHGVVVELPLLR